MIPGIYHGRFYRSWMFYLAPAQSAFANDGPRNVQVQVTKRWNKLPHIRNYMRDEEKGLPGGAP